MIIRYLPLFSQAQLLATGASAAVITVGPVGLATMAVVTWARVTPAVENDATTASIFWLSALPATSASVTGFEPVRSATLATAVFR